MCIVSVGSGARGKSPVMVCQWEKGCKKGRKTYPKWEKTLKKRLFKYKMGGGARLKGRGCIALAPHVAPKE
jgi:hypothetical protein